MKDYKQVLINGAAQRQGFRVDINIIRVTQPEFFQYGQRLFEARFWRYFLILVGATRQLQPDPGCMFLLFRFVLGDG